MIEIVSEYSEAFRATLPDGFLHIRNVDHEIETNPDEKFQIEDFLNHPIRTSCDKETHTKNHKRGRLRLSKIFYSAPLFFENQEGKDLGAAVDCRMLNKIAKKNRTSTLRSDKCSLLLEDPSSTPKMELKIGFYQVRVRSYHVEKAAFQTNHGQHKYLVMPIEPCSEPLTLTKMVNEVLHGSMDQFFTVYLDDTLIFSETAE